MKQRENQLLLNAALRTKSAEGEDPASAVDTWQNKLNNNDIISSRDHSTATKQQLKKYKCKSLDVSLDDLNANLPGEEVHVAACPKSTQLSEPWPGTSNIPINAERLLPTKEYSTTLPRVKGQLEGGGGDDVIASLDSQEDEEEEEEEFNEEKDEERRTLHSRGKERKKGSGNSNSTSFSHSGGILQVLEAQMGSAGTVTVNCSEVGRLTPANTTSNSSTGSRSKSLPQSVTNSMDCLTNEAYEDDEDLIDDAAESAVVALSGLRKVLTASAISNSRTATHDKDFITKL